MKQDIHQSGRESVRQVQMSAVKLKRPSANNGLSIVQILIKISSSLTWNNKIRLKNKSEDRNKKIKTSHDLILGSLNFESQI